MIMVTPQPGKYAHCIFYIFIFTTIHWVSDGSECVANLQIKKQAWKVAMAKKRLKSTSSDTNSRNWHYTPAALNNKKWRDVVAALSRTRYSFTGKINNTAVIRSHRNMMMTAVVLMKWVSMGVALGLDLWSFVPVECPDQVTFSYFTLSFMWIIYLKGLQAMEKEEAPSTWIRGGDFRGGLSCSEGGAEVFRQRWIKVGSRNGIVKQYKWHFQRRL